MADNKPASMTPPRPSPGSVDARLEALMEIRRIANEPGDRRALVDRIYGIATEACRAPAQSAWMPIKTAPKDKCIMLCVAGWEPTAGRWWPVDECWVAFNWEGHFESDQQMTDYLNDSTYEPTHWMPLPVGPSVSSTEQNSQ